MYLLVCASGRISWCGFRMERPLSVDAKGKRQESSGGGRVSRSLWKRVMLAISLRQRNDGQLSCLNRSVLGVRKGARRMERATAAWTRSMAMASCSRRLPCQTGDAYSSFGRRKYKYSCAVVDGRSWLWLVKVSRDTFHFPWTRQFSFFQSLGLFRVRPKHQK